MKEVEAHTRDRSANPRPDPDRQPRDGENPEWTGELGRNPLPLGGYAGLLAAYGASASAVFYWASGKDGLLERVGLIDVAVLALGSHKLARMVSKDRVTTVLRAPFTEYDGTKGALPGEAVESARRDRGTLRQAVGELLSCPYCTTTWAATALFGTYLANRKLGRTLATFLSSVSLAEMMQSVYHDVID